MRLGVVCGLAAEARLVRRHFGDVAVAGADAVRAASLSVALLDAGCEGLLSIGIAGALSPGLVSGTRLVPQMVIDGDVRRVCDATLVAMLGGETAGLLVGSDSLAGSVADKAALFRRHGAAAVDTESHAVARTADARGCPFAVLRVVADGAGEALPPAALVPLTAEGRPRLAAVTASILSRPGQLPALMSLALRTRRALAALDGCLSALPKS